MLKLVKKYLYLLPLTLSIYLYGCNSGEFDVEKYTINYTEKSVKVDTLRKITFDETGIKEDKRNINRENYTYTIQIGAFTMQDNLDKFVEQAKISVGSEVYIEATNNLFKVRFGSFNRRADAVKLIDELRTKGYNDAFVVTKRN